MREYSRHWTTCQQRKTLHLRWWGSNPLRDLWAWLCGRAHWYRGSWQPLEFEWGVRDHENGECYCPQGATVDLRLRFFTVGLWLWTTRSYTRKPCTCDKIVWLLFPDTHGDDIEDYGAERLRAEFTDMEAAR